MKLGFGARARRSGQWLFMACCLVASGCYTTFEVPVREATSLRPRAMVQTTRGTPREVGDVSTVEPLPASGSHYEMDAEGIHVHPGAEDATAWRVSAPLTVTSVGGRLVFAGADRTLSIAEEGVVKVRVRQFDEGKTAGAVGGVVGGALLVGTMIAVVALSAHSPSNNCIGGPCSNAVAF